MGLALACAPACDRPAKTGARGGPDDEDASADVDGPDEDEGPPVTPELLSPAHGRTLSAPPWVPLLARLPVGVDSHSVTVTLDGQPWSDPLTVIRRRNKTMGGGVDMLATLHLLPLSAGRHSLRVTGRMRSGEPVTIDSDFVYQPPPLTLDLRVVDGAGQPCAARIAVFKDGKPYSLAAPDALAADPQDRDTHLNSVFALGGHAQLRVSPGSYRLVAVRSVRDELGIVDLQVHEDATLTLTLPETVPTPGRLTADLHVHTASSGDAFTPGWARYASLAAAGLDVVVITDHERIIDPGPPLASVGATTIGLPGEEAFSDRKRSRDGHLNALPLAPGQPYDGGRDLAALIDGFRLLADSRPYPGAEGRVLIQLNHPRGIQFDPDEDPLPWAHGLFTTKGFDREDVLGSPKNAWMLEGQPGTATRAIDVEAMEIINRFSWSLYREVRADWFALLSAGFPITGTGNSDSHALAVETAGLPVNLVDVPGWTPGGPLSPAAFVKAIQEGHVTVSTGPVLTLRVTGPDGRIYQQGDLLSGPGPLTVTADLQAASWIPTPQIRLVVDGQVIERAPTPPPVPGKATRTGRTWTVNPSHDGWLLVEAGWPLEDPSPAVGGDYAALFPGHVPMAFTNPVRLDADGDGIWRPTR